jgi:hypothetical protein
LRVVEQSHPKLSWIKRDPTKSFVEVHEIELSRAQDDLKREVSSLGGGYTTVTFELPLLRPDEKMVLFDAVVYDKAELDAARTSGEPLVESVSYEFLAEDHRRARGSFFLAAVIADNVDALMAQTRRVESRMISLRGAQTMRLITAIASRVAGRPFLKRHMFVRQLELTPATFVDPSRTDRVAIDGLLTEAGPGTYTNAELAFIIKTVTY